MKKYILISICSVLSSLSFAQNYAVDLIPEALKSRASATIRQYDLNVEMKADNNVIVNVNKAITIYNKAGDEYARTVLFYDKSSEIKSIKGKVYNAFGLPVSEFNQKNFADESASDNVSMYNDSRVKHFLPAIQDYPYTVVISYELKNKQNLSIPTWNYNYSDDVSVEKSTFTFSCPATEKIRIKTQHFDGKSNEEEIKGIKKWTWEVADIVARKKEIYSPPKYLTTSNVKIVPERFNYYDKKGTFTNWKEFGEWVSSDLLAGKQQLSEATIQKVKSMTADAITDQEKAKILYQYMQNKTRYISIQVGIGGLQPFSAQEVDKTGYGDCKALVNYMQSLLNIVNIPSYYCIVEAGNTKSDVDIDFANVSDGNHIILALPFANDTTWLECTSQKLPFGYLGDFTDDRLVLAVTPEGGKVLRTPKYPYNDNLQKRTAQLTIDKDGSITGSVSTRFSGTQYSNHFGAMFLTGNEQLKELSEYYDIDNIYFQQIKYNKLELDTPALEENLSIFVKNYAVHSGDKMILHPNMFNVKNNIPDLKNRANPLYINRGYTDIDEITFELPEEYSRNLKPETKKITCDMGTFEFETSVKDDKLYFYRKLQLKEGLYPAEKYAEFSNFIKEVNQADKGRYTISKKSLVAK
ncbi:Domain of Uncharacterised Function with PDB structure [Sphingobacterium spiritivorum]|uniref:Domain of Uncharacterized Function with PDB structure n=1 Tax=Sphingobacterium spiritivorum TaxID=258 RepID=A0A380BQS1_SPHSI|nr:DUF3857 domain-containing transglutaminase family protein [Sphingobacterium spiritivorum]SUJ04847.1 Domain of Uncharacterised Function with PDB structure [Sphingobacterium spiritivorum]